MAKVSILADHQTIVDAIESIDFRFESLPKETNKVVIADFGTAFNTLRLRIDGNWSGSSIDNATGVIKSMKIAYNGDDLIRVEKLNVDVADYVRDFEDLLDSGKIIQGGSASSGEAVLSSLLVNSGNDLFLGQGGDNAMDGGAGADTMKGKNGNDTMKGSGGNDTICGGDGKDRLIGDGGADRLKGEDGKDVLQGKKGNDRLDGGRGNDTMRGDGGEDTFIFKKNYGKDLIADFQDNIDTIKIDDALWNGNLTKKKLINKYAEVDDGDIVFDFGKHELTIKDFTDLVALRNDIDII